MTAPAIIASWKPIPTSLVEDAGFVGGKAHGIFRLPSEWVPPFLVLTRAFYKRWSYRPKTLEVLAELSLAEQSLFDDFFQDDLLCFGADRARVIVRSNSPGEALSSRGKFDSYPASPAREAVGDALDHLFASAEAEAMCAIVQVGIERGITGHMSNERRVSQRRDNWLVEELTHGGQEVEQQVIQSHRANVDGPLFATNPAEFRNVLRQAAGFLTSIASGRFHCEWVWNGKRVWLVQADEASSSAGSPVADAYLNGVEPFARAFQPRSSLRHFRDVASDKWKKLGRPRLFHDIGVPFADVFLLPGDRWINCGPLDRSELERDFDDMCKYPVVVRCDVADGVAIDETLLATSAPLTDPTKLTVFLDEMAEQFAAAELRPDEWAFLLAFLVPARASAMVHARPRAQRIQVDALWGFPDGLSHFPHDRCFYYPETGKTVEHRRHKSHCLLPSDCTWETYELGAPFDWQSVLNEEEVATVADWALRVANAKGQEVELMTLARIGGQRGQSACLPWHYTEWPVPKYEKALRALPYSPGIAVISCPEDVDKLEERRMRLPIRGLLIRPAMEWRRNADFLRLAANAATEQRMPIYFEGSLLGHAYYIMQSAGATVIPVTDEEPKDAPKVYHKLVRDRIPVIIREAGGLARVRRLSGSHAIALLRQKLIEEAFEVWNAAETNIAEELADVLDVVEALASQVGISRDELIKLGEDKKAERGGFEEMLFLEETTIDSLRGRRAPQKRLFVDDDEVVAGRRKSNMRKLRVAANTGSRDLLTLEAPLTPPVNDSADNETVRIGSEVLEATVEYQGNRLVVRLSRPAPATRSNQRMLFPEMEDREAEHE